jgi:hypothetical protein
MCQCGNHSTNPQGETIMYAILTADFPAVPTNLNHLDLLEELMVKNHRFNHVTGQFEGNTEKSVIIFNISYDDAVALGKRYGQQSIIYSDIIDNYLVDVKTNTQTKGTMEVIESDGVLPANHSIIHFPTGDVAIAFQF